MEMKKTEKTQRSIEFDPPIRRHSDANRYNISVSLPGVAEEQIRIDLEDSTLTLTLMENKEKFQTEIHVPEGARIFRKKFSEGVLEISLEKTGTLT
jgi:HSP20 family molecular chaperone IbpA